MEHCKNALVARPYFDRVPDASLVTSETYNDVHRRTHHIEASRDAQGRYALIYSASGQPFTVNLAKLTGTLNAQWLDPRNGKTQECGTFKAEGEHTFTPPSQGRGHDWVLTLDAVG
jgi:hypothetical protein